MYKEAKGRRFEMRLSDEEREKLYASAQMCGITPTEYMRTLLWGLKPAKLPMEKYKEMLEQLFRLNQNLSTLTAEIKLTGNYPMDEIWMATQKIDEVIDEIITAIKHPFEVIDTENVRNLPMESPKKGTSK